MTDTVPDAMTDAFADAVNDTVSDSSHVLLMEIHQTEFAAMFNITDGYPVAAPMARCDGAVQQERFSA